MIRPVLERDLRAAGLRWVHDVRVPNAFPVYGSDPRPVAGSARSVTCVDGRHTFDVIEAVDQERWKTDPSDPDGDGQLLQRFRMVLTCLACGRVEYRAGTYHDTARERSTQVDPAPLRFRGLAAQMVDPGRSWFGQKRDLSLWAVHDTAGALVGVICPEVGRRGAVRHVGRLYAWPGERAWVRGASPVAVLRSLARAQATDLATNTSADSNVTTDTEATSVSVSGGGPR